MADFESRISSLDLGLFEKIESQSVDEDKRSLLACQFAVRSLVPGYNYLEIGSYLGGSIQPHLLDEKCSTIYSIDKRPLVQPDERGVDYTYLNNSTERMLDLLRDVSEDGLKKIKTIDGDTGEIESSQIREKIQLGFIDGEHTDEAAFRDFRFCLDVLDENGAIVFHDAVVTYNGIADCIDYLKKEGIPYRAYNLPAIVFVIEIGSFPVHKSPPVLDMLLNNHVGYLFSLQANDMYRAFANKRPFRIYRQLMAKFKGLNKFD